MIIYTQRDKIPFHIDDEDYEIVSRYNWWIDGAGYAKTKTRRFDGKHRPIRLHLLLFGRAPEGLEWDHINRNKLDNRRQNLRIVTHAENMQNRTDTQTRDGASWGSGVSRCSDRIGWWKAYIKIRGVSLNLGRFRSWEEARNARVEAEKLRDHPAANSI